MLGIFLFFIVFAYLLASISSAIIICKLMGLPDPRTVGSGNPGASNVLRIGGKKAALGVFLFDGLKGFIPVFLASLFGLKYMALGLVAFAAYLGHVYPAYYGFRGGKGVATGFGAILGLSAWLGLISLIIWLVVVTVTRYVSVASMTAAVAAAVLSPFIIGFPYFIPIALMVLLLIWRHQANIDRLKQGTESKISL